MKKYIMFFVLVLTTVSMTSCWKHVPPRNVGIKVKTMGDNKGVKPEVLPVGRYWIGMYWDLYTYPTSTHIYPFTAGADEGSEVDEAMKFQDAEGLPLSCDVAVSAHINPDLATVSFQTYGGDMEQIIKSYVRQDLLNSFISFASKNKAAEIYSDKKMDMLAFVRKTITEKYAPTGVVINDVAYKSDIRLPENVMKAINAKIQAVQDAIQAENKVAQSQAEAKQKVATAEGEAQSILLVAQAQAKANILLSSSVTSTLVQYELAKRWNGVSPVYSGNGSPLPLILK